MRSGGGFGRGRRRRRVAALGILAGLMLCLLAGCGAKEGAPITSLEQLDEPGTKIGVPDALLEFEMLQQDYPEAEIIVYSDNPLGYQDVAQGRLDAFVYARREMEFALESGTAGVRLLDENYSKNTVAVGLSPKASIPRLQEKINAFIAELKADGTLDDMYMRWVIQADDTMPEIALPENPAYHLRVGTTGTVMPYSYYVGTELRGYDIELAYRFAAWLGADIEFKVYDFGGIIAAAAVGDIDCIMSNLYHTEEDEKEIPFSDPLFDVEMTVMVRDTGAAAPTVSTAEFTEYSDLSGKKVSMLTGAPFEELVRSKAPDVGEFSFFNNTPDMILALKSGKTDAFLTNNAIADLAVNRNPELALFPQELDTGVFGIAFAKGDPARDEWQSAYDTIPEETKRALWEKWTGSDDSIKTLPEQDWPGLNGTVQAAVCDTLEPMSYMGDGGQLIGFDIEMILLMAKELDVHVEFTGMEFSAVMSTVQAGKALIGAGSIIATEERRQSVDFVDYYPAAFVLVVRAARTGSAARTAYTDFSSLEHARIGVTTGSIQTTQVEERFPECELYYYTTDVDMLNALKANKIDSFALAEALVKYMMTENPELTYLDESLGDGMQVGAIFPKTESGQALCDEFSAFIREIRQNGVYEEIQDTWYGTDEDKRVVPDLYDLPAVNGTLRMAADTSFVPFVYIKDGDPVGIDVDTVVRFCKEYGYGLELVPMDFAAIIPAVVSGKVDFACSGIAYTEERAESVLYSESTYESRSVMAVLKIEETSEGSGLLSSIADSFQKTFIREDRWKLFLEGIGTTLLITVLSIILGTALGFGVFMLCRNGNPVANTITRFCVWLVQGMPVVVLLMILYYIIFGKVAISGAAVSVVGFTLVFGAAVYAMLKSGVGAIDRGQTEAAYALGYTDHKAFYRVVLPQALPHFMPAYKGEITALIKATAVVGYVAVQDLTKMGDIVRSRTYEAFFPLIAVAVIYFILAAILTFIVNKIEIRIDPRRRSRESILKGVDVQ